MSVNELNNRGKWP